MLKYGEANPLNIFGLRRIAHCPPHFEKVHFDISASEKEITDWIYENLESRFYMGRHDIRGQMIVAFESPSEATYFSMILPDLNKTNYNL